MWKNILKSIPNYYIDDDDWLDYIAQASHEELERQSTEQELYDFMDRNDIEDN